MTQYGRRALAQAYIDAHPENKQSNAMVHDQWNAALRVHRQQMISGLQDLFALTLEFDAFEDQTGQRLFTLFENTVLSYAAITHPWADDRFAKPGTEELQAAGKWGPVVEATEKILSLNKQSAEAHLDILDTVLEVLLGERATHVFTSDDLRAIGIDDTPPNPEQYREEWENY